MLEDATFRLQAGQYTEPIRTKQGYVILKVVQHVPGGVPEFKDVEQEVEENYYESKMMPAMRDFLPRCAKTPTSRSRQAIATPAQAEISAFSHHLLLVYPAHAEEEEEGRAHPLPRNHAHLPAEDAGH